MNNRIAGLLKKHKEIILYLVFGGLTTLVNYTTYLVFSRLLGCSVVVSTILSWFVAVLFAYITNKIWVFESTGIETEALFKEAASFFTARAFSGVLDLGIMALFVDVLHFNDLVIKILSNIVVVIINYVLSKCWIFKKAESTSKRKK